MDKSTLRFFAFLALVCLLFVVIPRFQGCETAGATRVGMYGITTRTDLPLWKPKSSGANAGKAITEGRIVLYQSDMADTTGEGIAIPAAETAEVDSFFRKINLHTDTYTAYWDSTPLPASPSTWVLIFEGEPIWTSTVGDSTIDDTLCFKADVVPTDAYVDYSVTAVKMASGATVRRVIANEAVDSSKVSQNAIGAYHLLLNRFFGTPTSGDMIVLSSDGTAWTRISTYDTPAAGEVLTWTVDGMPFWTGAGSGTMSTVKDDGNQVGGADIVTLNAVDAIQATEAPDTQINLAIRANGIDDTMIDFGATGSSVSTVDLPMQILGTPTYDQMQQYINNTGSAGRITGGEITDAGSQRYDVAAGTGFIRSTDSHVGEVFSFDWDALPSNGVSDGTTRYVFVDYNAGSPVVTSKTTFSNTTHDEFYLGSVVREGDNIYPLDNPDNVANFAAHASERWRHDGFTRKDGLILGETGTRNITITAGEVYHKTNEFDVRDFDSSADDIFSKYRTNVLINAVRTAYDNENYDNAGAIASLTSNRYGVRWVYASASGGDVITILGTSNTSSLAGAQAEAVPTTVPKRVEAHYIRIGRVIIKQGAASGVVETEFGAMFSSGVATEHGGLAGLSADDHPAYGALASAEVIAANWDNTGNPWADNEVASVLTLTTVSGAVDMGGATSLEVPNGTDPDVTAEGQISIDTNGASESTGQVVMRGFDGVNQFRYAGKIKTYQSGVSTPNDFADALRDKLPFWQNTTGATFTVVRILAQADVDDTDVRFEEYDEDMTSNEQLVLAITIATGSGPYRASETTITHPAIGPYHHIFLDFDDTDEPGWVKWALEGWHEGDVD